MVNERPITSKVEAMKELLENEDIKRMWAKMHTPWVRTRPKVRRNEICPYCGSGKKYKHCECYKRKDVGKYRLDMKHTKGWN